MTVYKMNLVSVFSLYQTQEQYKNRQGKREKFIDKKGLKVYDVDD